MLRYRTLNSRRWPGFTLIELLTVIALISLLAAMLFPVFASVREKARQTVCASNLHQIGTSVALYVHDYDDHYPYALNQWDRNHPDQLPDIIHAPADVASISLIQDVLQPYSHSREVFRCPSDFGTFPVSSPPRLPSDFAVLGSSYDFMDTIYGETVGCFSNPTGLTYAYDGNGEWHSWRGESYWGLRENSLFYDGHVKMILAQNVMFGLECGKL